MFVWISVALFILNMQVPINGLDGRDSAPVHTKILYHHKVVSFLEFSWVRSLKVHRELASIPSSMCRTESCSCVPIINRGANSVNMVLLLKYLKFTFHIVCLFYLFFVFLIYITISPLCSKEAPEERATGWTGTGGTCPNRRGSTGNCSSGAQQPVLQRGQLASMKQWTNRALNMVLRTALRLNVQRGRREQSHSPPLHLYWDYRWDYLDPFWFKEHFY